MSERGGRVAADEHRHPATDRRGDGGKGMRRRHDRVQVAGAMVRHDHPGTALLDNLGGVVGALVFTLVYTTLIAPIVKVNWSGSSTMTITPTKARMMPTVR